MTPSMTALKASTSSAASCVPPTFDRATELATYVGFPERFATALASRVVKSMVVSSSKSGVQSGMLAGSRIWSKLVRHVDGRRGIEAYVGHGVDEAAQVGG